MKSTTYVCTTCGRITDEDENKCKHCSEDSWLQLDVIEICNDIVDGVSPKNQQQVEINIAQENIDGNEIVRNLI